LRIEAGGGPVRHTAVLTWFNSPRSQARPRSGSPTPTKTYEVQT
jgi:hypothetical protein